MAYLGHIYLSHASLFIPAWINLDGKPLDKNLCQVNKKFPNNVTGLCLLSFKNKHWAATSMRLLTKFDSRYHSCSLF